MVSEAHRRLMIEGFDIICVSTMDWEGVWGSRQTYMEKLSASNRIFFIQDQIGPEHLLKHPHMWKKMWRFLFQRVRQIRPNIWLIEPPLLLPGKLYALWIARLAQKLSSRFIRRTLRRFVLRRTLLWLYSPYFAGYVRDLSPELSLYFCIDSFSITSHGRKKRTIDLLEEETMRHVNLNIVITDKLFTDKARLDPTVKLVTNGCDDEAILAAMTAPSEKPADLVSISGPILGHMGSVNAKLDLGLIEILAQRHPPWQFVFVGALFYAELDLVALRRLKALPNVHFLGQKPRHEIVFYEKYFDVCLNIYRLNEWTRYVKPLKIFEYMATGKPVVSTFLPEIEEFSDAILIAHDSDEFELFIEQSLEAHSPERRARQLAHARSSSWNGRVELVSRHIKDILGQKGPAS